jgi:Domain of unknown function (DUF4115)
MLVDGLLVVVAVAVLAGVLFTRRRSHDDVHSVEGYHRQIHTLETMSGHPAHPDGDPGSAGAPRPEYPESAVRLAGTSTVRVTGGSPPPVPPVPPPPVAAAGEPLAFDEDEEVPPSALPAPAVPKAPSELASRRQAGRRDRAMTAMNRRPRRLAAPAVAVGGVVVLIVVLLVVGAHTVVPASHRGSDKTSGHTTTSIQSHRSHRQRKRRQTTTTTTAAPTVSQALSGSAGSATYDVSRGTFALDISATSGECWVEVTSTTSGATLFSGVLDPGSQHTVNATGPLTVLVGAPSAFAASVDGSVVTLPQGAQSPFTMQLVTPTSSTSPTSTTSSTSTTS